MSKTSRRWFLKAGAGLAALFTVHGVAKAAKPGTAPYGNGDISAADVKWDETFDVVIAGSGAGGIMAALSARKNGCDKVVVLEKLVEYGGNSALCNNICAVNSRMTKEAGIKCSVDKFVYDYSVYGDFYNRPEVLKVVGERSGECMDYMLAHGAQLVGPLFAPRGYINQRHKKSENSICATVERRAGNALICPSGMAAKGRKGRIIQPMLAAKAMPNII